MNIIFKICLELQLNLPTYYMTFPLHLNSCIYSLHVRIVLVRLAGRPAIAMTLSQQLVGTEGPTPSIEPSGRRYVLNKARYVPNLVVNQ